MTEKRILSMISRQGGKSRLYKTLIPKFPLDSTYYCEVFGGAGWVLLNKPEHVIEIYNDIDGNIVNMFRVVRDFPGEFVNRLRYDIVSRQTFDDYKKLDFSKLDPIDRAVKWYYVYYNSYNADMTSLLKRTVKTNPNRFNTRLPDLVNTITTRLTNVVMENLDFRDLLSKYSNRDFFYYLDPPYYNMHGYEVPFTDKDHLDLYDTLSTCSGKWMLSYNAHPTILELYQDYNISYVDVNYQAANRPNAYQGKTNKVGEIIVTNY
ncbi:MAG: hypothetical protein CTY12_00430 [Methylotenera sp.]|nr:MAG: hypothetical protein CTY12_00430 [Methylotenera sp.]